MRSPLETVPGPELLRRLRVLVQHDAVAEAELLTHLGEVDARRLYLEQACSSMFVYCVKLLHFAEGVAYKRIQVARVSRRHPELLEAIRRGDLHVTAASLLAPRLTRENVVELIRAAKHRTAEQVRVLLADREPRPDVAAGVHRIDAPAPAPVKAEAPAAPLAVPPRSVPQAAEPRSAASVAPTPPRPEPLGNERYCVRFTADRETWKELAELRSLMRHQVPDGDVGKILSRAVSALLAQVRRQKFAEVTRPKPPQATSSNPSRAIPAAIRRQVSHRDQERCSFVSPTGQRCGSRDFLEFHHLTPWHGARSHSSAGITLRCRAHNQHQAERDFGASHMARFRKREQASPRGTGFKSSS